MITKRARSNGSGKGKKNAGVSEIIGDILILGITVVLFTSIFFFVNAIPTPNGQKYTNFSASVDPFFSGDNPGNSYVLNITNQGGQSLESSTTTVVVQVNQSTSVFQLSQGYSNLESSQPWSAAKWSINQVWSVPISQEVYPNSIIAVSIISSASNSVIWSNVLSPTVQSTAIIIQTLFASPSPVSPGGNVTIKSSIVLPRGMTQSEGNITLNVSFLTFVPNSNITMPYNQATGLYELNVTVSRSAQSGTEYPITVYAAAPGAVETSETILVDVSNAGLQIVTAAITPDPASPGSYFNITAFIRDSYGGYYFNPPLLGSVNVTLQPPFTSIALSNITKGDIVTMRPTNVQGVYSASGKASLDATGYQTFLISAEDSMGNKATYSVTLFVFDVNSTGYPAQELGPASMSFSTFSWNVAGSSTYNPGYTLPSSDVSSSSNAKGVYFNIGLQNHNRTNDLYIDGYSELYFIFSSISPGHSGKIASDMSFIVINESQGATRWLISPTSSTSNPSYDQIVNSASSSFYPALGSPVSAYSTANYMLLPAALGGVAVQTNVSFGISMSSTNTVPPPTTSGGAFLTSVFGASQITPPAVSANFLLLFGYMFPAGSQSSVLSMTGGIPYGQSIPFTAMYWT